MGAPVVSTPQAVIEMHGPAVPVFSTGEPALRLVGVEGGEALSQVFTYSLACVTPPDRPSHFDELSNLDLGQMIGRELTVSIGIESAMAHGVFAVRQISGLVTEAHFQGVGDRFCRYRLVLRPWLHLAEQRARHLC